MSELKVYTQDEILDSSIGDDVYLQPDVDRVIAEKDKEIADKDAKILALDAEVVKQKHHAKLFFDERNYAETQLRHDKYKRCLDKANYWLAVSYQCVDDKHRQRAVKHRHKWLEFAKNFSSR